MPLPSPISIRPPTQLVFNAHDYGAIPDSFFLDGVATSSSTTFTSATAAFTSADVGKTIMALRAGTSQFQDLHTTIASVESATSCTLTNAAGRSQSNCRFLISRGGDQTTAIQAAIDACTAAGGGVVLLPGPGYLVTGLVLKNRVWLEGAGMRSTIVHLKASSNNPVIRNDTTVDNSAQTCAVRNMWVDGNTLRQTDSSTTLNGAYTAGATTITLTDASACLDSGVIQVGTNRIFYKSKSGNVLTIDLGGTEDTIDANASNGAAVTIYRNHGIHLTCNPYNTTPVYAEEFDPCHLLENVFVKNCRSDGVFCAGQSEVRMRCVKVYLAQWVGIRASFDTFMDHCTVSAAGRMGFYLLGSELQMTGCKAFNCGGNDGTRGYGFMIHGYSALEEGTKKLVACASQDNKADGFYLLKAQRTTLQACSSSSNGQAGPVGTYAGIKIDSCTQSLIDLTTTERKLDGTNSFQQNAIILAETYFANAALSIRITHGLSGTATVGTAIKAGSAFTGGNEIIINGMGGYIAPAFAASYTPDPYVATTIKMGALTGNLTVNAPSNAHIGCPLRFILLQDGTGGRTVTWNAAFSTTYANTGNTANKKLIIDFIYDGTVWQQTYMSQSATAATYWI